MIFQDQIFQYFGRHMICILPLYYFHPPKQSPVVHRRPLPRKFRLFVHVLPFQSHFQCPKPVIAAIHGPCVGGGTNMVTFADIRYCTQDAWFQVKEAALGELVFNGELKI